MDMTDKLTADQIIERIVNANGVAPDTMRSQIEIALDNICNDKTHLHAFCG